MYTASSTQVTDFGQAREFGSICTCASSLSSPEATRARISKIDVVGFPRSLSTSDPLAFAPLSYHTGRVSCCELWLASLQGPSKDSGAIRQRRVGSANPAFPLRRRVSTSRSDQKAASGSTCQLSQSDRSALKEPSSFGCEHWNARTASCASFCPQLLTRSTRRSGPADGQYRCRPPTVR